MGKTDEEREKKKADKQAERDAKHKGKDEEKAKKKKPDAEAIPAPSEAPAGETKLFDLPFVGESIDDIAKAGIKYQYSFDKHTTPTEPNPEYFSINDEGLVVRLHAKDHPFDKAGGNTEPRTELRFPSNIKDDVQYTIEYDQRVISTPEFDYGFTQVFGGEGPNLIVRYRKGAYQILSIGGDKKQVNELTQSLTPKALGNTWHHWKLVFKLSKKDGFSTLYLDGKMLCTTGLMNNETGTPSYIKLGLYAQQMQPTNDVEVVYRNFVCTC